MVDRTNPDTEHIIAPIIRVDGGSHPPRWRFDHGVCANAPIYLSDGMPDVPGPTLGGTADPFGNEMGCH